MYMHRKKFQAERSKALLLISLKRTKRLAVLPVFELVSYQSAKLIDKIVFINVQLLGKR